MPKITNTLSDTPIVPPAGKKKIEYVKNPNPVTKTQNETINFTKNQNLTLGYVQGQTTDQWGADPTYLLNSASHKFKDPASIANFGTNVKTGKVMTYNLAQTDGDKENTLRLGRTVDNIKESTTTNVILGDKDTLEISKLHNITGYELDGDQVKLTITEKKSDELIHTTHVTLPKSALEKITAGLSAKQQDAIQKFQNQIEHETIIASAASST